MNGDQMTEAIKSLTPGMPVIMVTGFADLPSDSRLKSAVPDLLLSKPITQATLRQAIAMVTFKTISHTNTASPMLPQESISQKGRYEQQ